jgi:hypothetical protein
MAEALCRTIAAGTKAGGSWLVPVTGKIMLPVATSAVCC